MPYDLFISYSRKDNVNNRVTELKEKIESEYLEFTNEELKCFFDKDEITGMDDWKHRLLGGLKDSDLLLLILSPHYIDSPYCEWEIVEYLKYEYSRATQGEGVAQIYFMEIPGLDEPGFKEKAKAWLEKVSRRQRFDFREWYDEGSDALKRTDVKNRLDELKKSLQLRITRMRRIVKAPGNLPAPNTRFVGREREMKLLHEYVGLGKFGVLTAVHGMGGLGKTAIAFQYAYTYADFYPGGRWQIGCANETNLAAVLKKLDLDLKVTFTEDEKKDDIRGAKRIINELEILAVKGAEARAGEKNPPKPAVLLLLDNVDHAELIQPPNSDLISGKEWLKILVTTRMGQEELGEDETMLSMLTIDELPFEDAVSLIESYQPNGRFKDENEKEKAGEIVKLLGRFTLAVEVAALYLNERRGRTTCTQLIEILKTKGVDFVGENTIKQLSHTKLISATLSPTLDTLSPEETMILNYASLLPSDSIPIPWLKALAIKEYPELGEEEMPGLDNPWISNINQLLSLRLLQIVELDEEGRNPRIVRMHRIVQETIQKRCDNKDELLQKLCDYALSRSEYLEENWYKKTEQWEINPLVNFTEYLLGRLHPTATRMVKYIGQWLGYIYSYYKYKELHLKAIEQLKNNPSSEQTEIAILLSNLSVVTQNLGNLIEAEKLLKTAIEIDEKYRERTHPFLSIRYSNIATLEIDLGNLKDAKEYLMKAIEIDEKNSDQDKTTRDYISLGTLEQDLGNFKEAKELFLKALQLVANSNEPEHAKFAMCYSKLASVENDIGNLMEAKEFIKKALQICDKNIESVHPDFAKSYSALASTEKALGNLKNSKELRYKALEIDEAIYESGHPNIAKDFNNLAIIEDDLGNFKEAKELYLKAIEIYEKLFEPWHPDLASLYSNLASVEKKLGNLKEAEVLYRKTLAIREASLPSEHPDTVSSMNKLANLLTSNGDFKEAETLYRKVLGIRKKNLGVDHPDTLSSMNNLAILFYDKKEFDAAESLYRQALEQREQILGPEHTDTLISLNNLAVLYFDKRDYKSAEPMYRRTMDTRMRVLGLDHTDTIASIVVLANLLVAKGDDRAAEPLFRQVLETRERLLGLEHSDTLNSMNTLAMLLRRKGDFVSAEKLYRCLIEIREKKLGSDHPDVLTSLNNLAALLYFKKDYDGAEPLYRRALDGRERLWGPENPETLTIINNLASLLSSKGDYTEAELMTRRVLMISENQLGAENLNTLSYKSNLAAILNNKGEYQTAELLLREVLSMRERILGVEHPDTLTSIHVLAQTLKNKGDYSDADNLFRKAYESRKKILGPKHPDTLDSLALLIEVLDKTGQTTEAKALRIESMEHEPDEISPSDLRSRALDYFKLDAFDKAEELLNRLLVTGFEPASTLHHLARVCLIANRFDEGKKHVEQGWQIHSEAKTYIVARLLWFKIALAFLTDSSSENFVGQLKTLFQKEDAFMEWSMQSVLDHIKPQITEHQHAFLSALVNAMSNKINLGKLNDFEEWRDAKPEEIE